MTWNAEKTRLLPQNATQEALEKAVQTYFMQGQWVHYAPEGSPEHAKASEAMEQSLRSVQSLMPPLKTTTSYSYEAMLILQMANDALEADGAGLAKACAEQGQALVCAAGCDGCCHQMVLSLPCEIHLMQAHMQMHTTAKEHFLSVWPVWQEKAQAISESYLQWGQKFYGEGVDDASHVREDYYIPCPLLNELGQCVAYAARPYACRSSVAVNPLCAQPNERGQKGSHNMLFALYTGHDAARKRLFTAMYGQQQKTAPQSMPFMLHAALMDI